MDFDRLYADDDVLPKLELAYDEAHSNGVRMGIEGAINERKKKIRAAHRPPRSTEAH